MVFCLLKMGFIGLTTLFLPATVSTLCPSGTVFLNVTSAADVQDLTDKLNCTGEAAFDIMWFANLTLRRTLEISNKNVTIAGSGFHAIRGAPGDHDAGDSVNSGRAAGMFVLSNGSNLHLTSLVLEGGNSERGGAVELLPNSSLSAYDCVFAGNNATTGGAIYSEWSEVYLNGDSYFSNNHADEDGGAIYSKASEIFISGDSRFGNNHANRYGGAICGEALGLFIEGNTSFSHNHAAGDFFYAYNQPTNSSEGGALYLEMSTVRITGRAMFTNNGANYNGGAVFTDGSQFSTYGNTEFAYNLAGNKGGAVYAWEGDVSMNGTNDLFNNSAGSGGAISSVYTSIRIEGNTSFANNSAKGAFQVFDADVRINGRTTMASNSAERDGGAIFGSASKFDIVGSSAFVDNSARGKGGAVRISIRSMYTDGSTYFGRNTAGGDGGALHGESTSAYVDGVTSFVNNSARANGGAMSSSECHIDLQGSTSFINNSAGGNGGAIYMTQVTLSGSSTPPAFVQSGDEGVGYFSAEAFKTLTWNLAFIGNIAADAGGAVDIESGVLQNVSGSLFSANEASIGGAVFSTDTNGKETVIDACVFEENKAIDGGALYFNSFGVTDTVTASFFRGNVAETSGGAILHTGGLRIINTAFVANEAGIEGPAITSIGVVDMIANTSFLSNVYTCEAGEYGYVVTDEAKSCTRCLDEVCERCRSGSIAFSEDQFQTDGYPVCVATSQGSTAHSPGTTLETLALQKGYYRTSNSSHVNLKCFHENACVGGTDPDMYCASGYRGPYCAVCLPGFAPGIAHSCRECSIGLTWSAVALAGVVALSASLVVVLGFSYIGSGVPGTAERDTGEFPRSLMKNTGASCSALLVNALPFKAIKIVVTVFQIVSQVGSITGEVYPELYNNFVSKLNPINFEMDFVLSYSCLFQNDFYGHLLVATIAPAVALVVLAGSYFVAKKRNSVSEVAMSMVLQKHQAAVLILAFFVYSPVSYKIFQAFACDELNDGQSYLRADYSITCETSRHGWYEIYASIMVGVYPVGIPAAFAALLFWHRHDLVKPDRDTQAHLVPLQAVWAAYKPSRYYYEVVECGRRIILTSIAALVLPNSREQIAIVLLVAVVFVFISEVISPFKKGTDMNLYRWGNGIIVASLYVAFLMKMDIGHDESPALLTFSGVLIAANVFMVVTVLVQTAFLVREWRGLRTAVRAVNEPVRRTVVR